MNVTPEAKLSYNMAYYWKNRDKILAYRRVYHRSYYQRNRLAIKAKCAARYRENREAILLKRKSKELDYKAMWLKHGHKRRAWAMVYRRKNRERLRRLAYLRSVRKIGCICCSMRPSYSPTLLCRSCLRIKCRSCGRAMIRRRITQRVHQRCRTQSNLNLWMNDEN